MRIEAEQLERHLGRNLAALYVIVAAEPLLALEASDRILAAARRAGFTEREVLIAEPGFDWSRLRLTSDSLSLFAAKRIIDIRIPSGKPGVDGAAALETFCARLPAATLTLVNVPKLDRAGASSAWFSALAQTGVVVSADAVTRQQLPAWIGVRLKGHGLEADQATLGFLAERVEGNLLAARNEVEKLALLLPPGRAEFEEVKRAVMQVARFDVYDLSNAMLAGDGARFARVLAGLRDEGEVAPLVLWALSEEIRALARIKLGLAEGQPMAQLLRENRVWGARQALIERAAQRIDRQRIEAALSQAALVDRMIKGVANGDAWQELLRLGFGVMGINLPAALAA